MHTAIDNFFANQNKWDAEMKQLRTYALSCVLTETLKWGVPCYTANHKNIVLIHGFKAYCALLFFKGALLHNANALLIQQTEHTHAARQLRFVSLQQIIKNEVLIKNYINEAIAIEEAGLAVKVPITPAIAIPVELQNIFETKKGTALKKAFYALTAGRQKAYLLYFTQAKQPSTRASRIAQYSPQILNGKGLHDCTCGLSKKMPSCDGSHRVLKQPA